MTDKRTMIHAAFLLLLPLVVAAFGLSFSSALLLVILAVLWRWAIVLLRMFNPGPGPDLVLETISVSHFAEKVRWCLDRMGVDYREEAWAGTLGAYYLGRSVPRLFMRTGMVWSQIGNSREILRYLWGAYAVELGETASFLEPTRERLDFESRLDRYGATSLAGYCLGDPVPLREVVEYVVEDAKDPQRIAANPLARELVYATLRDHYPCQ